ncbi:MAG: polysaccharide deacetylase family protein [Chitinophagaceae bacterium]|nr:polysaccharide deacetylase family protein [Chitinophagaceae bacterium]MCW5904696.1 polysaccharide deacetylase family protein [Chitinophagaceae bacterium]
MIIYSKHITPRLHYIVHTLLGNAVSITDNEATFIQYSEQKINYSENKITENELWICPHKLLFEKEIKEQNINVFEWNNLPVFFKTNGNIPFDFFAASFYLLTRYEEYLSHQKDMYGRYAHENSVAFKHHFLHLPLINLWLQEIGNQFSFSHVQNTVFTYQPTYDVDIAYSYQHHSIVRNIGSVLKDIVKGNISFVKERILVCLGKQKDPFDVFDYLHQLHHQYQLQPIYFFLLAAKRKGYDKNVLPFTKAMQTLIKEHAKKYFSGIGIHPSWQSGDDEKILVQEIELLKNIAEQSILASRQHYIRMCFPDTYQLLIQYGIEHDYSMGYGSINGFRASYTLPFAWYNIQKEETTALMIHPFCYMEANSFFEQKLTPQQAAKELQHYYNIVQQVKGKLITVFHNHFLTEQAAWIEWRKMYHQFLEQNFSPINT